ncbi:hypothetical protein TRFO_11605 [Tritrichomonas foetus]|uniref:Uncharacterized protein n=1 Tax=Tritrichomonas foetus TaxID=1144522 RepID=A0A1J4J2D3_9EUKA|nr:hypothetical protein TRFO_11605 [Tritrichomonas foetus]|eukprot:OHS93622.1 hypothetical protein TRFO_11605 [Tritrichomonas foetus]
MQRSTSIQFEDENMRRDSFSSLSNSSADLSRYQEQLARERNSRTLNLRHINRVTIAGLMQNPNLNSAQMSHGNLVDSSNFPFLEPSKLIEILRNNNLQEISITVKSICEVSMNSPRLLKILLSSQDVVDTIVDCFNNDISNDICLQLLILTVAIFPHCGNLQESFVDGLIFQFLNFFESDSSEIIIKTITTVAVFSSSSAYARDAILSMEIHRILIDLALTERSLELTQACCDALLAIFSNNTAISSEILIATVEPLSQLLKLQDRTSIARIVDCFVEMSNQYNTIIFNYYDVGLFKLSVEMLKDDVLIGPALRLIGNLSVAQPCQVKDLLNDGILQILVPLLHTEYAADSFWVLSNLLENMTSEVIQYFNREFVTGVIDIATQSNFEVMKEASFFLSTMILFTPSQNLPLFMDDHIIDILVTMLGCGVSLVILRCLDTLTRFLRYTQMNISKCGEFFTDLLNSDLNDRLQELGELETGLVKEKSMYVAQIMQEIEQELAQ